MSLSKGPVAIPASTTQVTLLVPNPLRANVAVYNAGSCTLYLSLGPTASSALNTLPIAAGGYYELPGGDVYQGIITGVWSATGGSAMITEIA